VISRQFIDAHMYLRGFPIQLGNPDDEVPASRNGKLKLPTPNSQAGAWELA